MPLARHSETPHAACRQVAITIVQNGVKACPIQGIGRVVSGLLDGCDIDFVKTAFCILILMLNLPGIVSAAEATVAVSDLRCEYLTNPLGIDAEKPRLSWVLEEKGQKSEARGLKQTDYQILVASSEELLKKGMGDLWDSGKVKSDQQNQLEYSGKPFESGMRCYWKVRVWLKEAGLSGSWLSGGSATDWSQHALWTMGLLKPQDWKAKWIGLDDVISENAFDHEITEGKLVIKKALYSGMDKANAPKVIDIADILNKKIDHGTLFATITPQALGVDLGGEQHLVVEYDYNGKAHILETPTAGRLGDICLPAGTLYLDTPEGLKERREYAFPRQLRKEFKTDKTVKRAMLSVTALGLYEFSMNGKRVGDQLLAPEWTDYNKHVQYQVFDVTSYVKPGANALGVILGNGWYSGGFSGWGKLKRYYGKEPSLLAQLDVEYEGGSRDTLATDGSWRGTTDGPVRYAGIIEGEIYDARKEMSGWDTPGFDDKAWKQVAVRVQKADPEPLGFKVGKLIRQRSEGIAKQMEITPVAITEPRPGVYVADMGQIFSGWTRLKIKAAAGNKITLQHGELLNPDGTAYIDNLRSGHFGHGDRQIDRYFCKGGGQEVLEPHFTYHGFRYVEIHGLPEKPSPQDVTGIVFHTGFRETGKFTSSNELLNRFVENIQWSQRANVVGIPTDCNQRDERCGYTGDMNFFMPAAVYNFDMAAFFNKWLVDVADAQMPGGWFADHAPYFGMGGGPNVGWSDAGILCPYRMYLEYGDTGVIKEHYASMKRAMEQLIATTNPDGTRGRNDIPSGGKDGGRIGHTDHMQAGSGKRVSYEVTGTAYLAWNAKAMAEMAAIIGQEQDAERYRKLFEETAAAFANKLIDAEGRVQGDSQTGYALAFSLGLIPDSKKALAGERFKEVVAACGGHLSVGFMGTPCLLQGLELAGQPDIAYKLLLQKTYPSWLLSVTLGATTIWENYGSMRELGKPADPFMNSFSHYTLGAVGGFIFGNVGGIRPETPGYKRILIQPVVNRSLNWTKTSYDSIYGKISTAWALKGMNLTLDVSIPPNTTATIYIPYSEASKITESGKPVTKAEGLKYKGMDKGSAVFEAGSGQYHFEALTHWPKVKENLTEGKTATMSGPETPGWPLSYLLDGDKNRGWSAEKVKPGELSRVAIDLGEIFGIEDIELYPRVLGDKVGYNFPLDFIIEVSDQGKNYKEVLTLKDYKIDVTANKTGALLPENYPQKFVLPEGISGRYVRITGTKLDGDNQMQIMEASVYGYKK